MFANGHFPEMHLSIMKNHVTRDVVALTFFRALQGIRVTLLRMHDTLNIINVQRNARLQYKYHYWLFVSSLVVFIVNSCLTFRSIY